MRSRPLGSAIGEQSVPLKSIALPLPESATTSLPSGSEATAVGLRSSPRPAVHTWFPEWSRTCTRLFPASATAMRLGEEPLGTDAIPDGLLNEALPAPAVPLANRRLPSVSSTCMRPYSASATRMRPAP